MATASNDRGFRQESARALACNILTRVDSQHAYADILLDSALTSSPLNTVDRALLTELIYGTLRWRGTIDARLTPLLRQPLEQMAPPIRNLLRVTLYQLIYLDKIPAYAAVNEAVELARSVLGVRIGGFVNGVLRNFLRRNDELTRDAMSAELHRSLATELSHPPWLVDRWLKTFGIAEATLLMAANNDRSPLVVRINRTKTSVGDFLSLMQQHGIDAEATKRSPDGVCLGAGFVIPKLPGFTEGHFQVQGESSQLVTRLLAPEPGEMILDACAAPGGKTTHIAEMMGDTGTVTALDISAKGRERISENAHRLGLASIRIIDGDAGAPFSGTQAYYDRILVDAPCSGLGTLRSHPEIKWQRTERDISRLSGLQARILRNVAGALKPGGVLVYSTCTISTDENESVITKFLSDHSQFELHSAARYLPGQAQMMVDGDYYRALPHRDNTDGFFAARLRKVT